MRPRTAHGLTLIEVLVALAIMAIGLMAGLQASAALTRLAERQTQQWLAQLCADNALTALRLQALMPALGENTGPCTQGDTAHVVRLRVTTTPNPSFRRAHVQVEADGAGMPATVLVDLSTVIGRH